MKPHLLQGNMLLVWRLRGLKAGVEGDLLLQHPSQKSSCGDVPGERASARVFLRNTPMYGVLCILKSHIKKLQGFLFHSSPRRCDPGCWFAELAFYSCDLNILR